MRAAASRTFCTAGKSRPIRMAMMAITTSSSISVKPRLRRAGRVNDMTYSPSVIRRTGDKADGPTTGPSLQRDVERLRTLRHRQADPRRAGDVLLPVHRHDLVLLDSDAPFHDHRILFHLFRGTRVGRGRGSHGDFHLTKGDLGGLVGAVGADRRAADLVALAVERHGPGRDSFAVV